MPCKTISGFVPKSGEKLICDVTVATSNSIYVPAKVTVSNF